MKFLPLVLALILGTFAVDAQAMTPDVPDGPDITVVELDTGPVVMVADGTAAEMAKTEANNVDSRGTIAHSDVLQPVVQINPDADVYDDTGGGALATDNVNMGTSSRSAAFFDYGGGGILAGDAPNPTTALDLDDGFLDSGGGSTVDNAPSTMASTSDGIVNDVGAVPGAVVNSNMYH